MGKDRHGALVKEMYRRRFLALSWWGVAGVLALQGAGATLLSLWPRVKAGAFGGIVRVPLSQLPQEVGEIDDTYVISGRFYLSRTPSGILVLYRKCPHLGCIVPWMPDDPTEDDLAEKGRFNCPCHLSIYDRYGLVHSGPAPRPMDLMAAWVEGDDLAVDTGEIIERSSFEESQAIPI